MFVRALSIIVSLAIAGEALAQAPPQAETVDSLLAMAPAPGVEALLISHANDVRVVQRWMGLLGDSNADLRLSAARALGVTNATSAAQQLVLTLAAEQDPAVISELLRAIVVVAPDKDVAAIYAHLDREGVDWPQSIEALAATRPGLVATHIRGAGALRAKSDAVGAAFARIARTQPAIASSIASAPEVTADATVLSGILQGATQAQRTLPASVVNAGLRHGFAERIQTLAYVAAVYGNPKAARSALGAVTLPSTPPGVPANEERWVRALEQRWLTGQDTERLTTLIATLPDARWSFRTPLTVLGVLSGDERKAYARRFALPDGMARMLHEAKLAAPIVTSPLPEPSMTLLTGMPGVMLAGVVRLTRCTPGAGDEQFAALQFRADGRPAAVGLAREPWSPGCERAAHAAVAMSYGPPPLRVTDHTNALVRLDAEFVACRVAQRVRPPAADGDGPWETVAPPTKLRNVPPVYPTDALNARKQGVVQVETHIEPTGCIGFARVARPVHPSLDAAAMRAVTRWQYTPTMLRGVPVPIIMTTTVSFSLQ